jgi:hypothetical protein
MQTDAVTEAGLQGAISARHLRVPIVTGDRKIIPYAAARPVAVLPC